MKYRMHSSISPNWSKCILTKRVPSSHHPCIDRHLGKFTHPWLVVLIALAFLLTSPTSLCTGYCFSMSGCLKPVSEPVQSKEKNEPVHGFTLWFVSSAQAPLPCALSHPVESLLRAIWLWLTDRSSLWPHSGWLRAS